MGKLNEIQIQKLVNSEAISLNLEYAISTEDETKELISAILHLSTGSFIVGCAGDGSIYLRKVNKALSKNLLFENVKISSFEILKFANSYINQLLLSEDSLYIRLTENSLRFVNLDDNLKVVIEK